MTLSQVARPQVAAPLAALRRGAGMLALVAGGFASVAALAASPGARVDRDIEARLRSQIAVLASDEFEGREPGTEGEAKTLRYLGRQWFEIGLVSGTNEPGFEWFAPVNLVGREPATSSAQFLRKGRRVYVPASKLLLLTSGKRALVRDAPLLFLGDGRGHDLTRNELAGRVAVILDAGEADSERQNRLLSQGAAAVLTVLDGKRSLDQVAARRKRSGYALANDATGGDLEGFITGEAMAALIAPTGRTLASLEKAAAQPGFRPEPLDVSASFEATSTETRILTHNLLGKLPGRRPEQGAVLFVAHWDHFGICGDEGAEDRICNGAIDNASGVAALTEIARRLARGGPLDRDVYFLATTGEELGLLGAHAFAENPPLPTERIVAAFNIDSIALAPRGTPFGVVGAGMTDLDATIARVAKAEKVKVRLDPASATAANEYVRRQDGWALLQHDIPAVMVTTAYGDVERVRAFFDGSYHRPGDDLTQRLELGGAVEDVKFLSALGRWFADARRFQPRRAAVRAPGAAKTVMPARAAGQNNP